MGTPRIDFSRSVEARNVPGRLYSFSRRVQNTDALSLYRLGAGRVRSFWADGASGLKVAGVGCIRRLEFNGSQRFSELAEAARVLMANLQHLGPGEQDCFPRLLGGFGFSPESERSDWWSAFGSAQFVLPEFQLTDRGGETWLTVNMEGEDGLLRGERQDRLARRLGWAEAELGRPDSSGGPIGRWRLAAELQKPTWISMVDEALAAVQAGTVRKVVLARTRDYEYEEAPDSAALLARVTQLHPDSFQFAFEPAAGTAWLGASPERLASCHQGRLESMALAGTSRRGASPEEDERLAQTLLADPKEGNEHQLVVDCILDSLGGLGGGLAQARQVRKVGSLQHLYTPIQAENLPGVGLLQAAAALHPTAALCGTPRQAARALIERLEPEARGWFGGAMGWLDAKGEGDFAVAIRSALLVDRKLRLYAGAGIVADSTPEQEWLETGMKFEPMAQALLGVEA